MGNVYLDDVPAGKRPQSSMAPTILVDANGTVVQVIGASGGSKITSVTAYVSLIGLFLDFLLSSWIICSLNVISCDDCERLT